MPRYGNALGRTSLRTNPTIGPTHRSAITGVMATEAAIRTGNKA